MRAPSLLAEGLVPGEKVWEEEPRRAGRSPNLQDHSAPGKEGWRGGQEEAGGLVRG